MIKQGGINLANEWSLNSYWLDNDEDGLVDRMPTVRYLGGFGNFATMFSLAMATQNM